ncbi:MAG: hypothetical protein U0P81_12510 [Holophagaceae bacterium]
MPTPPKPKPATPTRRAAPPALRFELPDALHKRTLAALKAVEGAEEPEAHREALAEVVVALMERGLDAYFLEPLEVAGAGFVTRQSAKLGLSGAQQVMGTVIRNILGRMDGDQLRSVCGSIRGFMA